MLYTENKERIKLNVNQMSPLALAFVGDAVYELHIRDYILSKGNLTAGKLHKMAIKYVCAQGQAYAASMLKDVFTDEEAYIFKRGRNAWSPTVPKNCTVMDYRQASALEALIGYLHLSGEHTRVNDLINLCIENINSKDE